MVAPTESGIWQSKINSPEAVVAVDFFKKLVVGKWRNAKGELVGPAAAVSSKFGDDIRLGNTSMWFAYTNDVVLQNNGDLPPSVIGVSALPAGPAGTSNEINAGMWAINSQVKDQHQLVIREDFLNGDDGARLSRDAEVEHAFAAATLEAVFIDIGALAAPLLRNDQQGRVRGRVAVRQHHADHAIGAAHAYAAHAGRNPAHEPNVALVETDSHALRSGQNHFVLTGSDLHVDQLVARQ